MPFVRIRRAGPGGFTWDGITVNSGEYLLVDDNHPKLAQMIGLGIFEVVDDELPPDAVIRGKSVEAILAESQPRTIKPLPQVTNKKVKSERK